MKRLKVLFGSRDDEIALESNEIDVECVCGTKEVIFQTCEPPNDATCSKVVRALKGKRL